MRSISKIFMKELGWTFIIGMVMIAINFNYITLFKYKPFNVYL